MNISVLDKAIDHYDLSHNPIWKTLDTEEKKLRNPILKGKLRIELMTKILCKEILKGGNIQKDFIESAKTMGMNLNNKKARESFIQKVGRDMQKSDDKTMLELGASGKHYFKYYASFFKILRNINPTKFNINFDFSAIKNENRKQMGNYLGTAINDLNKMNK
jgi:hypothetical protein